jgi:hypothetical protein
MWVSLTLVEYLARVLGYRRSEIRSGRMWRGIFRASSAMTFESHWLPNCGMNILVSDQKKIWYQRWMTFSLWHEFHGRTVDWAQCCRIRWVAKVYKVHVESVNIKPYMELSSSGKESRSILSPVSSVCLRRSPEPLIPPGSGRTCLALAPIHEQKSNTIRRIPRTSRKFWPLKAEAN